MEANKFEQEIQQKFNQRKIQPSDSAWERLSDKLDAEGQQKKKGWLLYIGYAASIALIISLFSWGILIKLKRQKIQLCNKKLQYLRLIKS